MVEEALRVSSCRDACTRPTTSALDESLNCLESLGILLEALVATTKLFSLEGVGCLLFESSPDDVVALGLGYIPRPRAPQGSRHGQEARQEAARPHGVQAQEPHL